MTLLWHNYEVFIIYTRASLAEEIQLSYPKVLAAMKELATAIIKLETWDAVQKIRAQRRLPTKMGEIGMFSGLAYCAAKLYHFRTGSWTHEQECYTCSSYRTRKGCSAHYIRAVVLEQLVLQNLQRLVAYAQDDEDEFVRRVMEKKLSAQMKEREQAKRTLEKQQRRSNELDAIIQRLYEDNITGKLTDERFAKLSQTCEREQAGLNDSIARLSEIVRENETQIVNIESFLKIVRKYTAPTEFTSVMLRELVEKVVVHAPDKSSSHCV